MYMLCTTSLLYAIENADAFDMAHLYRCIHILQSSSQRLFCLIGRREIAEFLVQGLNDRIRPFTCPFDIETAAERTAFLQYSERLPEGCFFIGKCMESVQ